GRDVSDRHHATAALIVHDAVRTDIPVPAGRHAKKLYSEARMPPGRDGDARDGDASTTNNFQDNELRRALSWPRGARFGRDVGQFGRDRGQFGRNGGGSVQPYSWGG